MVEWLHWFYNDYGIQTIVCLATQSLHEPRLLSSEIENELESVGGIVEGLDVLSIITTYDT